MGNSRYIEMHSMRELIRLIDSSGDGVMISITIEEMKGGAEDASEKEQ